ncbi:DUF6531 domain-containing protein [Kitasatospora sp. Root107]|uniref:DUF6531 domain-containing protein n=1 Tax=Kitasatospora sp. Root107 TaxID=1736424 RepID=UPI00070AC9DD|nr:DUF6531 domain-containing protein [Kitasatospora sp. Root107]KQV15999.1 hypothetical protein ASC99_29125 [Kitasatospora sp. Root107]
MSDGFKFDPDSMDNLGKRFDRFSDDLGNSSSRHHGRAKSAFGRTRGKGGLAAAAEQGISQLLGAMEQGQKALQKHLKDVGRGLEMSSRNHKATEQRIADALKKGPGKGDGPKSPGGSGPGGRPRGGGGNGPRGKGERPLGRGDRNGQAVDGNNGCRTAGDPVDVVSGQMITSETDLALPGLLPMVLRRAYASNYLGGRLFGQGWSSTLDQRIEIDADGIHFAGDDAQILHYPLPSQPGVPVVPTTGAQWPLTWDQATDTVRIEDPDRGWTRHFVGSGGGGGYRVGEVRPISSHTDRNGHQVTFLRDETGTLTEVGHSGGYRVAVDTTWVLGPAGQDTQVAEYQYYPDGQLAGIVNSTGLPYIYEYDDDGRMTAWIDRNGQAYEYEYDNTGRVVRGVGQNGFLSAAFHYDVAQRVTVSTDSLGQATEYHYDDQLRVVRVVDPLGNAAVTEYDEAGRVTARIDEIGRVTRLELDGQGDPVRITEPGGAVIELAYTGLRQLASVSQGGATVATFSYDPQGNLLASTDAAGALTSRQYDGQGRLVQVTDPLGQVRRMENNAAGLVTAITDPLGNTTRATYDAFGRAVTFTDTLGAVTALTLSTEGQVTERVHPDGTRESWGYDPEGNLVQHELDGAVTRFETGPFGRLAARTLPDGEVHRFEYDTELQLLAVSMNGAAWRYSYDRAGHLTGESDFNGRVLQYRLDGADQLLEITDSAGQSTTFSYDPQGRITQRRHHDGTATTLSYDERGLLTRVQDARGAIEYTHDAAGRVLSESVDGHTTAFTYDPLGRRTSRTTPSGIVSTWTYDANSQPAKLSNPLAALTFAYDAAGRETTRYLGTRAALTQTWDTSDRLSAQSIWATDPTPDSTTAYTNLQERTYSYRADGMPAAVTDRLRGRRDFDLTPAGRVTRVRAETWSESYAYDVLGNITHAQDSRRPDSAAAGERTYNGSLLRSAGRTAYQYDEQGRLTRRIVRTLSGQRREWRYSWNAEDQLVKVDTPERGSWAYAYDPVGRRAAKWRVTDDGQAAETVHFVWDGVQLIEQYQTLPDGSRRNVTWDWAPGAWAPLSQTERHWDLQGQALEERFYAIVTDLADTPSELVTPDGQVVWTGDSDLWGRRNHAGADGRPSCPLGRPGQYYDSESGLEYNYFRYYDPSTGRYLNSDPIGLDGGPNPHSYVPNPLFWSDPLGLAARRQPVGWGGSHYSLRPSNWTDGSDTNAYERNHMPARDSYLGVGTSQLGYGAGPAIRMDYDDHRAFISTGSGAESIAWRAKQRSLIAQGKFDVAMKMDIGMIRKIHGNKYDAAIKEMVDHLPNNKNFQKYLSDNGWKMRTCLLK